MFDGLKAEVDNLHFEFHNLVLLLGLFLPVSRLASSLLMMNIRSIIIIAFLFPLHEIIQLWILGRILCSTLSCDVMTYPMQLNIPILDTLHLINIVIRALKKSDLCIYFDWNVFEHADIYIYIVNHSLLVNLSKSNKKKNILKLYYNIEEKGYIKPKHNLLRIPDSPKITTTLQILPNPKNLQRLSIILLHTLLLTNKYPHIPIYSKLINNSPPNILNKIKIVPKRKRKQN